MESSRQIHPIPVSLDSCAPVKFSASSLSLEHESKACFHCQYRWRRLMLFSTKVTLSSSHPPQVSAGFKREQVKELQVKWGELVDVQMAGEPALTKPTASRRHQVRFPPFKCTCHLMTRARGGGGWGCRGICRRKIYR
ncbi:MFS domain-containing protein [Psidium guajava]|nr:MFS domain-containing protein [Psidium guajava]